ncbi:MAG: hypothetical protein LUH13_01955, partial [Oscillospiraceae bacterium]|nr:hypothetical protein [Oscillospiraceae bacterium]
SRGRPLFFGIGVFGTIRLKKQRTAPHHSAGTDHAETILPGTGRETAEVLCVCARLQHSCGKIFSADRCDPDHAAPSEIKGKFSCF